MEERPEKPDHKKLGRELDLFLFSERVGPGLPLWTPRGTLLRDLLDDFVWQLRQPRGYQRVDIPHLTKPALYQVSGHWDKFSEELFKVKSREDHEFALKPMNCPHHVEIYLRRPVSYRELPLRYASTTKVYRDEQTGELNGLVRARAITIDDAHVFCRPPQVRGEIEKIWKIINEFYRAFGLEPTEVRISLSDPKKPEKYLGHREVWQTAEETLRQVAQAGGLKIIEAEGEAAFYGPKMDFMVKDSLGREWQVATIQLDMNMPERFDLTCVNEQGQPERIVMVHAAIMGSLERFLAVLLEHTGGQLPLWLAPEQVRVLPIGESHQDYAQQVSRSLQASSIRATLDNSGESLSKKIRDWKTSKVPYALVLGDAEVSSQTLTVESHKNEKQKKVSLTNFLNNLEDEIRNKTQN